jgi:hypothetical protein
MIRALVAVAVIAAVGVAVASCNGNEAAPTVNFIVPTPTPAPPATPTPTPVPAALLVQTGGGSASQSISMGFTAAGAIQNFTASESNYTGAITVTNNCSGSVVTLAPGSGSGPAQQFGLTSVAAGGPCTIVLHDTFGQTASVSVTVTTTSGTIQ